MTPGIAPYAPSTRYDLIFERDGVFRAMTHHEQRYLAMPEQLHDVPPDALVTGPTQGGNSLAAFGFRAVKRIGSRSFLLLGQGSEINTTSHDKTSKHSAIRQFFTLSPKHLSLQVPLSPEVGSVQGVGLGSFIQLPGLLGSVI